MIVRTRFAPSPTGLLHIGGARTALFNYLFARHHGGAFLLRIEDTDRERSTAAATDVILDGLAWLGLETDEAPIFQSTRQARHAEVAQQMLAAGHGYRCFLTAAELNLLREQAKAEGRSLRIDSPWRDRDPAEAPAGAPFVIRLRAPREGETVVDDLVQGEVRVGNAELDDMIILRSDGSPTYLHAVVVDDHDMGITHVIRGDDHLTNTFRQIQLLKACGWEIPSYAHIPLIHGPDGAKLSKRHGALGAEAYRDMGFLPEAIRNYLLRLGWGHGDDEIITTEQAIEWFGLEGCGRSPSRFDMVKLTNLNGHYMREADNGRLVALVAPRIKDLVGRDLTAADLELLEKSMTGLKDRAKTLIELAESAAFFFRARPLALDEKATKQLEGDGRKSLEDFAQYLAATQNWRQDVLEEQARQFAEARDLKLGKLAQPLRAALTGSTVSPPIFEVMQNLGREECLGRINDALRVE